MPFGPYIGTLVVVIVGVFLQHQLFVGKVNCESANGDSEAGESRLEPVEPGELALISPGVSFGPRVAAHGGVGIVCYQTMNYSQMRSLAGTSCRAHKSGGRHQAWENRILRRNLDFWRARVISDRVGYIIGSVDEQFPWDWWKSEDQAGECVYVQEQTSGRGHCQVSYNKFHENMEY